MFMSELGIDFQNMGLVKMTSNLHHHEKSIDVDQKSKKYGHKPCVVWLTGLSGSGKSTIANLLETRLFDMGCKTHLLDGDNVRMGLNKDLGFLPHERKENIRRIGEVANLFAESGMIVMTAFISPYAEDRDQARLASSQLFLEVHIDANLQTCEERDPKGLYKKARAGLITGFTGIDAPYEAPEPSKKTLVVTTHDTSPEDCVDRIIERLCEMEVVGFTLGQIEALEKNKTVAIDFDGVIHAYSKGFQGLDSAYDVAHVGAHESIKKLYDEGYRLVVLTSRPAHIVRPWLKKNDLSQYFDAVTNVKVPAAFYIDDHAISFAKGSDVSWDNALEKILGEREEVQSE